MNKVFTLLTTALVVMKLQVKMDIIPNDVTMDELNKI